MKGLSSSTRTALILVLIGVAAFLGFILGFGASDGGAKLSAKGDTLNQITDPADPITAGMITQLNELIDPATTLDRQFEILASLRDSVVQFMDRADGSTLSADKKAKIKKDGDAILAAIDKLIEKKATATRGEIQDAARKINKSIREFSLLWVGGGSGAAAVAKALEIARYNNNGVGGPPRIPYWQARSVNTGDYGTWTRTDCSGFLMTTYNLVGRRLPMLDTGAMLKSGIPGFVDVTSQIFTDGRKTQFSAANPPALQPGDLIVYRGKLGHVVMYTGSDWTSIGSIVHSTGSCCPKGSGGWCLSCGRAWPTFSGPQVTSTAASQLRKAAQQSDFKVLRPE